jgi:acetyl esterase/lipase
MTCSGQQVFPLYPDAIPNSRQAGNEEFHKANDEVDSLAFKVSVPTISVFLAGKSGPNSGPTSAVIIFPGGGYGTLLVKREGSDVARAFNKLGITAFVVKYRLPSSRTMIDQSIGPLQDAQQAIKMVREHARSWNIDSQKIGVMGFSAGGHLASTLGTHFAHSYIANTENTILRPDFMLLINPVISFTDRIGHIGSRNNLLGENAPKERINLFSNELQVTKTTPPAFLVHAGTDVVVPVANSLEFYQKLHENGVPGEIHIYSKGEHGFLSYPTFQEWFGRCTSWMKTMKYM